jgi:hypothetical protein
MVRPKAKYVLSVTELQGIKQEKKEVESTIKAMTSEGYGEGTRAKAEVDVSKLRAQSQHLDRIIAEGSPDRVSGVQKDRIAQRAAELSEQIQQGMPTREEMRNPGPRHPGAIQKNVIWEKNNLGKVLEWKQLQRQLNPNDPTSSNVESLRREK